MAGISENIVMGRRRHTPKVGTPVKGRMTVEEEEVDATTTEAGEGSVCRSGRKRQVSTSKKSTAKKAVSTGKKAGGSTAKRGRKAASAKSVEMDEDEEEGKRPVKRRLIVAEPKATSTPTAFKSTPTVARLIVAEPKATSTPTTSKSTPTVARSKMSHLQTTSVQQTSSPLHSVSQYDSPQHIRQAPRKGPISQSSQDTKGPIPREGSHLFVGMTFLLTHIERSEEQKEREKLLRRQDSHDVSTDSSDNGTGITC